MTFSLVQQTGDGKTIALADARASFLPKGKSWPRKNARKNVDLRVGASSLVVAACRCGLPEGEMQMLPYGNLGKGIAGGNAPEGLRVPCSGIGRLLVAFAIMAALALLFDASAPGRPGNGEAIRSQMQQGR